MSCRTVCNLDINIDEATSHWLNITVNDEDNSAMDMTGFSAVFTSCDVEKLCDIQSNIVTVKLEPTETKGYLTKGYQVRIFDSNDDIFQVVQGTIYIRKAHKPYTQNSLGGER